MAEVDKSEKITINIGLVDLGQIDLLVDEGFYANRTDFIRTAIRRQLESRAAAVNNTVARRTLTLGTQHLSRRDLEELATPGRQIELRVLGLATIADDVSPELGAGDDRLGRGPRRLPGAAGGQGRARRPHHRPEPSRRRRPTGPTSTTHPRKGHSHGRRPHFRHVRSTAAHPRRATDRGVRASCSAPSLRRARTAGHRAPPIGPRAAAYPMRDGLLGQLRARRLGR